MTTTNHGPNCRCARRPQEAKSPRQVLAVTESGTRIFAKPVAGAGPVPEHWEVLMDDEQGPAGEAGRILFNRERGFAAFQPAPFAMQAWGSDVLDALSIVVQVITKEARA